MPLETFYPKKKCVYYLINRRHINAKIREKVHLKTFLEKKISKLKMYLVKVLKQITFQHNINVVYIMLNFISKMTCDDNGQHIPYYE